MADKKTSNAEEPKKKAQKADKASAKGAAKSDKKASKKKSAKENPFKSMGKFFKSVNSERKQVVWPKAKDVIKNSVIVLIVVIIVGVPIYLVDTGLSLGMKGLKEHASTTTTTSVSTTADTETTTAAAETTTQAAE